MISGNMVFSFQDASVVMIEDNLTVSTGKMKRSWIWTGRGLLTTSVKNIVTGQEWTSSKSAYSCDWSMSGLIDENTQATMISIDAKEIASNAYTSSHIEVVVEMDYPASNLTIQYLIWVYPGSPGVRTQLRIKGKHGFIVPDIQMRDSARVDYLPFSGNKLIRRAVGYYNHTQHRNTRETEIIKEEIYNNECGSEEIYDWASLMCLENTNTDGICLVKESHKCVNQPGYETGDFRYSPSGLVITGWGIKPDDIVIGRFRDCWANWCIVYNGDDCDRELTIKIFDRFRYPVDPARDIYVMANTWGSTDNNIDARNAASEENVITEIESCSDLGIDVLQIDDGWQTEKNAIKAYTPHWRPHIDRYPDGWKNVKALAKGKGLTLGLWASYKISEEELIKNYDEGDFRYFKIDFAVLDSYEKIERTMGNARRLYDYSKNSIRINWDVTENSPRVGYFFARDLGNIYLENRKPEKPENTIYIPYLVLRDAWQVAKYLNLNKFQIPVQNIDMVNREKSNAHLYDFPYCVAITLMGSPIFFQQTHYLSEASRDQIRSLLILYKNYRQQMYEGYVFPIGDKPDDSSWSGFQSHIPEKKIGYIMIFRELKNDQKTKDIKLKFLQGKRVRLKDLRSGTDCTIDIPESGRAFFQIDEKPDFKYYCYEVLENM